jgi:ABC-type branched-subunit amino acid transport system substrate-binding protein
MTANRVPRTRLGLTATLIVSITLVMLLTAFGGSSAKGGASMLSDSPTATSATAPGVGVTPTSIKVGIALVNFDCIKQFSDSIRINQQQVYQAYIDNINKNGGVAGRQIKPVYASYCPLGSSGPLAVCTKLTDDDKVFAIIGNFVDFSGDAQTCVANQHKRVLITYNLSEQIMKQSPPGLIIYPGATNERTVRVLLQLMKKEHLLKGKKAAVLGGSAEANTVNKTIVPGLKKLKVPMGSTAVLSINGTADTTAAQAQLDSFIEKWKGQHVNTIFLSGDEVSSKQFVTKLRQEMPKVLLVSDTTDTRSFAQQVTHAGIKPNPYQGMITAGGPLPKEYDKSANYKYCAAIYKKGTGKTAPKSTTILKGPGGKTLDTYGSINDACQSMTMFDDIATRAGKNLNDATWVKTVNTYGPIVNRGSGKFSSLHTGKYDTTDDFRLQSFDSSIKPDGDWKSITPVENITGD